MLDVSRSPQAESADSGVVVRVVMPSPVRTGFFGGRPAWPLFEGARGALVKAVTQLIDSLAELIAIRAVEDLCNRSDPPVLRDVG